MTSSDRKEVRRCNDAFSICTTDVPPLGTQVLRIQSVDSLNRMGGVGAVEGGSRTCGEERQCRLLIERTIRIMRVISSVVLSGSVLAP